MLRVSIGVMAIACAGLALADSKASIDDIEHSLGASERSYLPSQMPVLIMTVRNDTKADYEAVHPDPMVYGLKHPAYQAALQFEVHEKQAGLLAGKYVGKDPAFFVRAVLKPGEQITYLVPMSDVLRETKEPFAVGAYKVSHTVSCRRAIEVDFVVKDKDEAVKPPAATKTDEEIRKFLADGDTTPLMRVRELSSVYDSGRKDLLWELLSNCDDAYAVVTQLSFLSGEWLDTAGLKKLSASKDLAIRRAAMRAFCRLGTDADAAKWLQTFLKTQEDELTLKQGEDALKVLLGKERPAAAKPSVDGRYVEAKAIPIRLVSQTSTMPQSRAPASTSGEL